MPSDPARRPGSCRAGLAGPATATTPATARRDEHDRVAELREPAEAGDVHAAVRLADLLAGSDGYLGVMLARWTPGGSMALCGRLSGPEDVRGQGDAEAADGHAGAVDELVGVETGSAAEGAAVLRRRPAFPPAGRSGGVDSHVALQLALDGGDVDAEFVEDAAGAAAG